MHRKLFGSIVLSLALLASAAPAQVPITFFTETAKPGGLNNDCQGGATRASGRDGGCNLLSSSGPNAAVLPISGTAYATVKASFPATTSPAQITLAYSIDGGTNWLNSGSGAPYAKDIGTVAANPTVKAFVSIATSTTQTWELPLAQNVTHVKAFVAVTGTNAQAVTLSAGQVYVPGIPVNAVLYDVAGGAATNSTGTLETSGWASLAYLFTTTGTAPTAAINTIDDSGTATALVTSTTAATNYFGGIGAGLTIGFPTAGLVLTTAQISLPKRVSFTQTAATVTTSRWRIEARR